MRLLVTRPQPEAAETAARLEVLGHNPVLLPLSRVDPLPLPEMDLHADAGVASSVNSIRHAPQWLLDGLRGKPIHVVGEATARAVRAAGLTVGRIAEGAESLPAILTREEQPRQRLAYLCGKVRLPIFMERMRAAGFPVQPFEVYDTIALDWSPSSAAAEIGSAVDGVLLYSAMAARAFRLLAAEPEVASRIEGATFYCLSPRIAAELEAWPRVQAAARADQPSLFALLDKKG